MHEQPLTPADIRIALEVAIGTMSGRRVLLDARTSDEARLLDMAIDVLVRLLQGLPADDGR